MPYIIFNIFIFILGAIVGSFLNVCIWRLPQGKSIIFPSSHCPKCKHAIPWFDNIPLISFIILKARCRFCGERISARYFIVEFLTAALFLGFFILFGANLKFVIFSLFGASLIVASFIDLEHQIIPDEITLGGFVIGIILSALFPKTFGVFSIKESLMNSLLGALIGSGAIFLTGVIGKMIFKKDAMGGGDVKFMAMIGAFLGWKKVLLTFFIAPFFGTVVGIVVLIKNKSHLIPYGPFLSLAAFVALIFGDRILRMFVF